PPPTSGLARLIWLALGALAVAILVTFCAGIVWGLGKVLRLLSPVLWPLAVAGVIAYLLDPVVDFIERRGAARSRAILCVFALAAMIVAALVGSVVPQVVRETGQLLGKIPTYSLNLQGRVQKWINNPPALLRKILQLRPEASPPTDSLMSTNSNSTNSVASSDAGAEAPSIWSGVLDPATL